MKRVTPLGLLLAASLVSLTCATTPEGESPCPDDARLVGAAPPAGTEQSCVRIRRDGRAENHGAFAQWYENLKPRTSGQFRWGAKCGPWTEHPADGGEPSVTDHGPCPEVKPCQKDSDCEPPFTKCDEGYHRCVDGCYHDSAVAVRGGRPRPLDVARRGEAGPALSPRWFRMAEK